MAARKRAIQASNTPATQSGRYAYEGLDRVFHEKARLGIMTSLSTRREGLSFPDLKLLCALSDGNLNRHLAVLQEAGFVEVEKAGGGRTSRTLCRITQAGHTAFLEYVAELERVLADAAAAQQQASQSAMQLRAGFTTT